MKKSTAFLMALACLLIGCFGTYLITTEVLSGREGESGALAKGMEELYWYLDTSYYQDADLEQVNVGAYKGAITALGDPYSEYLTTAEYNSMLEEESGEYSGIGVTVSIDQTTGYPYAVIVHKGSPAEVAGVQVNDLFMAIDGTPIDTTKSLSQIASELKGEEGTKIVVTVYRDNAPMEIEITRGHVTIDKVEYRLLPDDIGYLKILEFNGNCMEGFDQAIAFFQAQGVRGIVLDLRDNPGGYVDYATAIADALLPAGDIVTTRDKQGREQTTRSDAKTLGLPISVLMNAGSASSSEILAGALHDNEVGEIVGVTSFGKALVQRYYPLRDSDGFLKITIASYFTPGGTDINGKGIEPDYEVELAEEQVLKPSTLTDENDLQLKKAIEVLKPRMAQ